MAYEPFPVSFAPAEMAVKLLAAVANDAASPHREAAIDALERWRKVLATPEQIAMAETSDDLEVDDTGACIAASQHGFFLQTWTWIPCHNFGKRG